MALPYRPVRCGVLLLAAILAAAQVPKPQLVQSIPVETGLEDPRLPHAKDVWPEMVRAAKHSVDLAEFYVTNGPDRASSALEPTLRALEEAGLRGVKIRVLLSSRMLDQDPSTVARLKAIPGAEVRPFDFGTGVRGILHAKYFLVDGTEAFLGSQNLDWRALQHIHETGLRFRTPELVKPLLEIFELDWAFAATKVRPAVPKTADSAARPAFEVVASPPFLNPPGVRPALPALTELLGQAKERIRIQLLTYSPVSGRVRFWPTLDNALRAAAVRGTKVQLIVADWNLEKPAVDHLKSLAVLPGIEIGIVTIPEAASGHIPFARVTHSKYMTVDGGVLWLGTSNWSEDYFTESRNVEIIARDQDLAAQADGIFERLWNSRFCAKLDPSRTYVPRKRE
jgi:phosphatidylserine/phosphatidylglycerophosphate/cardiolipin synthase-like enzyme